MSTTDFDGEMVVITSGLPVARVAAERPTLRLVPVVPDVPKGDREPVEVPGAPPELLACAANPSRIDITLLSAQDAADGPVDVENARLLRHALQGGVGGLANVESLNGRPGLVCIGSGTFPISGGLQLADGQQVVGTAPVLGTTLRLTSAGVLFTIPSRVDGVQLRRMRIEHEGANSGTGLSISSATRISVLDVWFVGLAQGVRCARDGVATSGLTIEGCTFDDCTVGISARGGVGSALQLVRVVSCAFSVDRADRGGAGIDVSGENLLVQACHFEAAPGVGADRQWSPATVLGRDVEIRYNVFDAPSPHVSVSPGSRGVLVEHNVHLGAAGRTVVDDAGLTCVNRGPGVGRVDSGESIQNLLLNGSFEWWDQVRVAGEAQAVPVGWRPEAGAVAPLRVTDVRRFGEADVPPGIVSDPQVRHGERGLTWRLDAGGAARLTAEPVRVSAGGAFTVSCWVRVGLEHQASQPRVAIAISDGESETQSEFYRLAPFHSVTWQRLACTLVARSGTRTITVSVLAAADRMVPPFEVDLDGAAIHRGHLALDPGARVVNDAGGEVLGPVDFAGAGSELVSHLRLVQAAGARGAVDAVAIPAECRLRGFAFSSADPEELVQIDVTVFQRQNRVHVLPRLQARGTGVVEIQPEFRVVRDDVVQLRVVDKLSAPVDVTVYFAVTALADGNRPMPYEPSS